jgi:hypothetical protein
MPSATNPDLGPPFDAGRALALSLGLLTSHAGAIALMTVLIHLPELGFRLYLIAAPAVAERVQQQRGALLAASAMFLTALSTTAIIHRVLHQIQGKSISFVECLRLGFGRTSVVLGINLATMLLVVLGSLAFVVPGLVAATALFVAAPVAVAEGRGVIDSLRRSAELTRGSRWRLFGLLVMVSLPVLGLSLLGLSGVDAGPAQHPTASPRSQALTAVLLVLFQALMSVTMTIVYLELRRKREGAPNVALAASPD